MGDGTKENPYTRKDVLRMIKENGGTAKGLDLFGKTFRKGINLDGLNLKGVILTKARLVEAHLEGAKLRKAHLEEANLRYIHLERADLSEAYVRGADLRDAHLEGAHLANADLRDTHLEKANLQSARLPEARLRRAQLQEADLTRAHLERGILRWIHLNGAHLRYIHFEGADLRDAHLEKADLRNASLQEAQLQHAQLQEADLTRAHLEGTSLHDTEFSQGTKFVRVHWGDYIIGEEQKHQFLRAGDIYRRLKMWYTNAGIRDIAAKFYYREMEATRKNAQRQLYEQFKKPKALRNFLRFVFEGRNFGNWVRLWIYRLTCGYGERPWQVVVWGMSVLIGSTLLYFFLRGVAPYDLSGQAFLGSLYYSAVSFTALGYGPWFSAGSVRGWVQGVGAAEAIIGVFMIALFLVTFVRKMTR